MAASPPNALVFWLRLDDVGACTITPVYRVVLFSNAVHGQRECYGRATKPGDERLLLRVGIRHHPRPSPPCPQGELLLRGWVGRRCEWREVFSWRFSTAFAEETALCLASCMHLSADALGCSTPPDRSLRQLLRFFVIHQRDSHLSASVSCGSLNRTDFAGRFSVASIIAPC